MTKTSKIVECGGPDTPMSAMAGDDLVTSCDGRQSPAAAEIARGTTRFLSRLGYSCLSEFALPSGQRADIAAVSRSGKILIVEIKSCLNDFRTDQKWTGYREYCDELYFAVKIDFPAEVLPEDAGLILADKYSADIVRPAPETPLAAARRKVLTLRFARASAQRLSGILDPALPIIFSTDPD
jgi:hypothetical protein